MNHHINLENLKAAASGRWPEILAAVGGIDPLLLDGKHHPCPRCGGKDRFRLIDDAAGALLCNQCFKTGNGDGISAVQWMRGIDFPSASAEVAAHLGLNGSGPRIVATYDYRDEQEVLLFQVCRYEPKDFRQRRPDGAGGWTWKLDGVQRVLYRLPELLATDPSQTVYLVEGEKDADKLVAEGLVATTNSGGAGKWRDEYNESLRGRSVVIVPDNDEVGRAHADQVARSLYGIAASVRIAVLAGLPPKGDVTDWLAAGGTTEKLYELANVTAVWKASAHPWPEIISFDVLDLPNFPTQSLPNVLRQWVGAESHATQTPADLAGLLSLAVTSACIARKVVVEPRAGWREPVNLYSAVLLEPGNRKSAVFTDAVKPLRELETELIEAARPLVAREQSERRQEKARLQKLEKLAAEGDDPKPGREAKELAAELTKHAEPELPRLIVDDATSEKLGMMLDEQGGCIASLSPEGGVFDLMAGMYSKSGSPQFEVYLKGHSGDELMTDRISRRSVRVLSPAITCGYAIQPEVIRGLAQNSAFRGRGLLARFLYAAPRSWIGKRSIAAEPVSNATHEAYRQAVRGLHDSCQKYLDEPYVLRLCNDAARIFHKWEEEIENMLADGGEMERIRDWGAKLAGATLRLAAVMHCVEFGPGETIQTTAITAAIEIARYLIPHANAVLNMMSANVETADDDARYVLRWIERHGRQEFTKSEAQHHGKRRFSKADDIDRALAELVRRNYLRPRPSENKGPGRPTSPGYDVNPAVFVTKEPQVRSQNSRNDLSGSVGINSGNIRSALESSHDEDRVQVTL
jgi:hypothetical protein